MRVRQHLPQLFLFAFLVAPSGVTLAQERPAPRDPHLAERERLEHGEQDKRNREREYERQKEWREPKATGCQSGQFCPPGSEAIQSHRVPGTGLVAILHDIDVEDHALTVRLRFYNEGTETGMFALDPTASYDAFYVELDGERSFILRDEDGDLEAKKSFAGELDPVRWRAGGHASRLSHRKPCRST